MSGNTDSERELELVRAWLDGYAHAMLELQEVLEVTHRRRWLTKILRRRRGYGGGQPRAAP